MKINPLSEKEFRKFIPKSRWFKKDFLIGIHGLSHTLRVMIYTYVLCQLNHEERIIPFMVAASIHDLKRSKDERENEHGLNAAEWFLKNTKLFPRLKKSEINSIYFSVANHDVYGEVKIKGKEKAKLFYILKTADALDRFRLKEKKWWPDQKYIPIKLKKALFDFAKKFTLDTKKEISKKGDVVESIIKIAKKEGVLK